MIIFAGFRLSYSTPHLFALWQQIENSTATVFLLGF
jgi:hypothetical protein